MKKKITKRRLKEKESNFCHHMMPSERVQAAWEISCEAWSIGKSGNVESRLQRHHTKFIRKQS